MVGVEPLVKTIYLWNSFTILMTTRLISTKEIVDRLDAIYGCAPEETDNEKIFLSENKLLQKSKMQ
jgi:hypothetical protein